MGVGLLVHYHSVLINADGTVLVEATATVEELSELSARHGLKRDFQLSFDAGQGQGQVSNPAGVAMAWRMSGEPTIRHDTKSTDTAERPSTDLPRG